MYTQNSIIDVWPFTRQTEGGEVIIGRPDTGTFLAVSPEAVEILDSLARGRTVAEVAEESHSDPADVLMFLTGLTDAGLVKLRGADEDKEGRGKGPKAVRYHLAHFPLPLARAIFSWPALSFCFALIVAAVAAVIVHPALRPRVADLYFIHDRTLILTSILVVSFGSVVIHEICHLIAARAQGVESRLGVGNRLWAFVVEADLTGLWSISRRKRYLPLLAGSLFDAVMSSAILLVLFANRQGESFLAPFLVQLLRAILLTYVTRILWQFCLFVRTDYYYVIANAFGCRNLMGDTETFLRNQVARIFHGIQRVDQSSIPLPEFRVVRGYAVLWILGRIIALTFLFEVTLPLVYQYTVNTIRAVSTGYTANRGNFIDSILMSCIFGVPFAIGMGMWLFSLARRLTRLEIVTQ